MHGAKKRATTNCLPCADHSDEECKFHCGTCDRLLCSECIVSPDHGIHKILNCDSCFKSQNMMQDTSGTNCCR